MRLNIHGSRRAVGVSRAKGTPPEGFEEKVVSVSLCVSSSDEVVNRDDAQWSV